MKLAKPLSQISLKRLVIMSSIFGVLSIYGFNCSQGGFLTNGSNSGSNNSSGDGGSVDLGVGLLTSEQILKSFSSMLALKYDNTEYHGTNQSALNPDNLIVDTYKERSGTFPVEKNLEKMTGPQLISVTNLAAAFCNKLVIVEKETDGASRRFFGEIDFNAGSDQISSNTLVSVAGKFSRILYSRDLTDAEAAAVDLHMMGEFQSEIDRSAAASSTEVAIGLCTAMLSALDVLVY